MFQHASRAGAIISMWVIIMAALLAGLPYAGAAVASNGPNVALSGQVPSVVAAGGATLLGPLSGGTEMSLNFGLPLRNQAQLEAFIAGLHRGSTPLTQTQFDARYGPTPAQVAAVRTWAESQGLTVSYASPDGLTIVAHGTAASVEAALHVQINTYRDTTGRTFFSAAGDPQVPATLGLQSITGLDDYTVFHTTMAPRSAPQGGYYPSQFRAAYDVDGHGADCGAAQCDGTGQTIGLVLWGSPMAQDDLTTFAQNTGDTAMTSRVTQVTNTTACPSGTEADMVDWCLVNGAATTPTTDTEIAMDTEAAHGMATHSHLRYFLSDCGDAQCNSPDNVGLEAALSMAANDPTIHIVSNSWGGHEASPTSSFYQNTTNTFMHAAAVGTTFYFATGDNALNSGGTGLPQYPSDSPYVVAVGGTHLEMDGNWRTYFDEGAWNLAQDGSGGGGGCSNVISRPWWQIGVIAATCSGRAVPDIAAEGDPETGAYVWVAGAAHDVGGTSLATPLVAGMAATTDHYLALHGQPRMGWAAPTIYGLANSTVYHSIFHDVTCGSNGYPARAGWDQATGWGSEDWYNYTLAWAGQTPGPIIAPHWGCQPNGGNLNVLKSVSCPVASTCYAVGDSGTIMKTSDSGTTWTQLTSGTATYLYGIACPTMTTCYAVGDSTQVLKTGDGGVTWTWQSTSLPDGGINSIVCVSATTCFAVGGSFNSGGLIVGTSDGGTTWVTEVSGVTSDNIAVELYGISCPSALQCYFAGSFGVAGYTSDGGQTWYAYNNLPTGLPSDLFTAIDCPAVLTCAIVGGSGTILHTSDGGATWNAQTAPDTLTDLYGVACPDANTCYAVGAQGDILQTFDAGAHWGYDYSPFVYGQSGVYGYHGVTCPDNSSCYSVGDSGAIIGRVFPGSESIAISRGWNAIGVPRQLTGIVSFAGLVNSIDTSLQSNGVDAVMSYGNGRFSLYVPGFSQDAPLQPGEGLMVASHAAGQWTMSGLDYVTAPLMNLLPGWNLVAIPYPLQGVSTDAIAAQSGCNVEEAALYTSGRYETWTPPQGSAQAFTVAPGSSVWLLRAQATTWRPQ